MMYAIRNKSNAGLAWSDSDGWVDDDSYDLFTFQERDDMELPPGGEWWRVD